MHHGPHYIQNTRCFGHKKDKTLLIGFTSKAKEITQNATSSLPAVLYHLCYCLYVEGRRLCLVWSDNQSPKLLSKGKALEASLREKRMVNTGTQCGKQALTSTGSNHQRRPRRSLSDVGVASSRHWHVWLLNMNTNSLCLCTHGDLQVCENQQHDITAPVLLHYMCSPWKSGCQVALQNWYHLCKDPACR